MTDGKRRLAGRYRIDGLLGRGGMSEVYFGYDERLDRPVAVKLLRPPSYVPGSPDSPEAVEILDALDRDQKRSGRCSPPPTGQTRRRSATSAGKPPAFNPHQARRCEPIA